jgi:hypothetical protein
MPNLGSSIQPQSSILQQRIHVSAGHGQTALFMNEKYIREENMSYQFAMIWESLAWVLVELD